MCVFKLSITSVIFSAPSYLAAICSTKKAQSRLVTAVMRLPARGSLPKEKYSLRRSACIRSRIGGRHPDGSPRLGNQLLWRLVHTYDRVAFVVGALVDIEYHFHMCDKVAIVQRRNYPSLFLPGLDFVFFRTRRTVSCETLSM